MGVIVVKAKPLSRTEPAPKQMSLLAEVWAQNEDLRAAAARQLHDDQAGDLVGLSMDLVLMSRGQPDGSALALKLGHFKEVLDRALKLNRALVEILRPSLLDNIGLIAALRWRLSSLCRNHGASFTSSLPELESAVEMAIGIHLYRISEEWLMLRLLNAGAGEVHLVISEADCVLSVNIHLGGVRPALSDLAFDLLRARAEIAGAAIQITQQIDGENLAITCKVDRPASRRYVGR